MRNSILRFTVLYRLLIIMLLLGLNGCGHQKTPSSGSGSIIFSLRNAGTSNSLDCTASGVATVEAVVYDSDFNIIMSGGPWDCSAHSGTLTSVPPGGGLIVDIMGKDSNGGVIYFGEQAGITVANGQTTNIGVIPASLITTLASDLYGPQGIAVDSDNLYWTEYGLTTTSGSVKMVGINGGTVTTLASGLSSPQNIAVDATHVYWTEGTTVRKVGINGGAVTNLATANDIGGGNFWGIAVDSDSVYFTEYFIGGSIRKVGINGGTVATLASGLFGPQGIALDSSSVYWVEAGYNGSSPVVKKVGLNGGDVTVLAAGNYLPSAIAVDSINVYWPAASATIDMIGINGGTMSPLTSALHNSTRGNPKALTVDSSCVYWTELDYNIYGGTVRKVGINGGTVTTLAAGLNGGAAIKVDSDSVYWVDSVSGTIKKISK